MRRLLCILITFTLAISVAIVLRCIVFGIYFIPHDMQAPVLRAGDRVLVKKWAYGIHLPWQENPLETESRAPEAGDWVAFRTPDSPGCPASEGIGCLMAGPGDTVWVGPHLRVSPVRNYSRGCIWPLVIPRKGDCIKMSPWNVSLYARTIRSHEGAEVAVQADRLTWKGKPYRQFRFHKNYYWIYSGNARNLQDSRTLGFLPREAIVGQATTLLYSLDRMKPWYSRLRTDRLLRPLEGRP